MAQSRNRAGRLRAAFSGEVQRLDRLFYAIQEIRPTSKYSYKPISWAQAEGLSEGVFMKMFVLWEDYQERLFQLYLLGHCRPDP